MGSRPGVTGPLAEFAAGFAAELIERGYRPGSAAAHLGLMADVSGWLAARGLGAGDLSQGLAERVLVGRRGARSRLFSPRALSPLLEYLRGLGVAPLPQPSVSVTVVEVMIGRYSSYLFEQRCLARSTVRNYLGVARVFASWREAAAGGLCLERLDAAAVSEFVLEQARRSCVGSAKCMVTRLRALLRFLYLEGEIEFALADAVPSVAGWRLASLVKALDSRSLARLLRSCDRRTRVGRRDFAIITLLSRLGLRAGEVAALELGDLDWRAGELLVRGKGSRQERLPLPADVGETLVACCPLSSIGTTAASDAHPAPRPLPGSTGYRTRRSGSTKPQAAGPGRASPVPPPPSKRSTPHTPGGSSGLRLQTLHPFHGLHREARGSAPPLSAAKAGS